jgi:hypothetical protein
MRKITDILPDDEALEKENPLLHSISKENPFSVPENYFDGLPSEIVGKCGDNAEPKHWGEGIWTKILSYKWRFSTIMGCIVLICIFTFQMNNHSASYEAMAQNIPDSLIVEHLNNNLADVSVSNLEDLQEQENSSSPVKSASDSASADQDIIAYLINSNVSVSDIVNEP